MKYLVFCIGILFFACRPKEQASGGPCSYKTTTYPATVIRLASTDSMKMDAFFVVKYNGHSDTLSYFSEKNAWLKPTDSIAIGSVFRYEVDEIRSGSCTPRVSSLVLEPYNAGN